MIPRSLSWLGISTALCCSTTSAFARPHPLVRAGQRDHPLAEGKLDGASVESDGSISAGAA